MAADVFFTTNPAEFSRLPGLYISERNPPGFIRGRNLSGTGFFGRTVRGPSTIETITSLSRFLEVYGGRDQGTGPGLPLINEVWKALVNKPFGTVYVKRVTAASGSLASSVTLDNDVAGTGTDIIRIDASSVGAWGNNVKFRVDAASNGNAQHFNLVVDYLGEQVVYANLNTQAGSDNLAQVIGDDPANFVVVTKLADGRPATSSLITEATYVAGRDTNNFVNLGDSTLAATYSAVTGAEGTLAASDYTAALAAMATVEGPAVVLAPESLEDTVGVGAQATLNGSIVTTAPTVSDRIFLTWSGVVGQTPSQNISSLTAQITTRSDRIMWCYNSPKTIDPDTSLKIDTGPHHWMASIMSQNDVDIHPGAKVAAAQTAGISELNNQSLTRGDLISLRDAGISPLEKLPGQFTFRDAVMTDLTAGKTQATRRRSADFLQLSAADRLRDSIKAKNTRERRAQIAGELTAFSQSLRTQSRIVENFELDQESVNTPAQRAQGIEKILWRVKLIDHILSLVLETEIGNGVVIEAAAA